MKVLHVISEMEAGGAETLVVELIHGMAGFGWAGALATAGGALADRIESDTPGTVHHLGAPGRSPSRLLATTRRLRRIIRITGPDVILAHNVRVALAAEIARRTLRPPVPSLVTVFHGVQPADYRSAARILSVVGDLLVCVAQASLARLRAEGLRSRRATCVIHNAVINPTSSDRALARRSLEVGDRFTAVCLARMVPQKRHDVLIDAWAQVDPGAVLLLAGDGPLRADVEARAQHLGLGLGLGDRVRFLGVRRDVPRLLAAADVTVLSSDWEGLPMAVLESMAAGVPVVATDVDGVSEAVGDTGLLVAPGDPAALAGALERLRTDPALRARLGRAATERIAAQYQLDGMIVAYDAALRRPARDVGPIPANLR